MTSTPFTKQITRVSEIALRVIADFLIVHASAMAALLFVAFRLEETTTQTIVDGLSTLRTYYLGTFLPLSLIFPAVYTASGMYTRLRTYSIGFKVRRAFAISDE